ncbi:phosphotransferase [Paragemmobacter ruber]|uniref:Hydroxylysine kinase n=1 Tax=Paragemmobacter ruber TaxID=1985673 RepID=A0ABW9Y789_9RHOB|nr:phosphotransferase [Rhodobacter ruber]NBE08445.1 phosphotransferase [Rhodobacter ruber]
MTSAPLGPLLDSRPPAFAQGEIAAWLDRHWALSGDLAPLTSERDQNHRLDAGQGRFVVKIANVAEPHALPRFQSRALRHAAARDPSLPIPRVVAARDGADDVVLPSGHLMRVLTWLDGAPLAGLPASPAQAAGVARLGARLTRAMGGFSDPAADHVLQWDIKQAARLRPLLVHIADPALARLATAALDRFDAHVAPALPGLRWQVIHGDLNPHNVLGDPARPDQVTGILDFGDMVHAPIVCDLAVAAAYALDPARPGPSLAAFAAAWAAEHPLTRAERDLLPDLVAARMVTTLAITGFRAARYPENAAYILRNAPSAAAGLASLADAGPQAMARALSDLQPMDCP